MSMIDSFDVEERELMNRITQDEAVAKFTRSDLLTRLEFALSINTDKDILDLCEGLHAKIHDLTELEWEQIRAYLPFDLPYSNDDRIPEELNI